MQLRLQGWDAKALSGVIASGTIGTRAVILDINEVQWASVMPLHGHGHFVRDIM